MEYLHEEFTVTQIRMQNKNIWDNIDGSVHNIWAKIFSETKQQSKA